MENSKSIMRGLVIWLTHIANPEERGVFFIEYNKGGKEDRIYPIFSYRVVVRKVEGLRARGYEVRVGFISFTDTRVEHYNPLVDAKGDVVRPAPIKYKPEEHN